MAKRKGTKKLKKPSNHADVGYRRPPKHTQFKPGHSGNPNGRPKNQKNAKTTVHDVLNTPIMVTRNGTTTRMPAVDAVLLKLLDKALNGDIRAATKVLNLQEKYEPEQLEPLIEAEVERRIKERSEGNMIDFENMTEKQLEAMAVLMGEEV